MTTPLPLEPNSTAFAFNKDILFAYLIIENIQVEEQVVNKAKQGDANSLFTIGEIYFNNLNYPRAIQWYKLAVSNGHDYSHTRLALIYTSDVATSDYYIDAEKTFKKALDNGYVQGGTNLGLLYEQGLVVTQDCTRALPLFYEAAKKGCPIAQYRIGRSYEYGYVCEVNIPIALYWYSKSAAQNYDPAKMKLKHLSDSSIYFEYHNQKDSMSPEEKIKFLERKLVQTENTNRKLLRECEVLKAYVSVDKLTESISTIADRQPLSVRGSIVPILLGGTPLYHQNLASHYKKQLHEFNQAVYRIVNMNSTSTP